MEVVEISENKADTLFKEADADAVDELSVLPVDWTIVDTDAGDELSNVLPEDWAIDDSTEDGKAKVFKMLLLETVELDEVVEVVEVFA